MTERLFEIAVTQDYVIPERETERAYVVPISDWGHLRKKVDRVESGGSMIHTLGAVLLGVAGTALVGALTLPEAAVQFGVPARWFCWALFAGTLGSGGLCWYFVSRQRKMLASCKEDVLSEMDRIKERQGGG